MATDENDGLMTEEQLKQSLNDTARGRLRRAGYKLVWETGAADRGDLIIISAWVPKNLPLDKPKAYKDSIFYQDFVLVERPGSNSYYVHGEPKGYIPPDDGYADDWEHERQARAVEEQTDSNLPQRVEEIVTTAGTADEANRLMDKLLAATNKA